MSHIIFKYPFPIQDAFSKVLPVNSKILKVECQHGIPTMWILHTTNTSIVEPRHFRIFGTGREVDNVQNLMYVGTFQMHNGDLIWHVFEEIEDGSLFVEDILKDAKKIPTSPETTNA